MDVYGQLFRAQLEVLSSNAGTLVGRIWWNKTDDRLYVSSSSDVRALLRNDQNMVIGTSGTASENIRIHRGAATGLQFVAGDDATAEGSLSNDLAEVHTRLPSFNDAGRPANANIGRLLWNTDRSQVEIDDGTNWIPVGADTEGGINYVANGRFEIDATGWATYADAAGVSPVDGTGGSATTTFARSTSSPLRDDASGLITKDNSDRQGEGISYDFSVDDADLAKMLTISFDYDASVDFGFNGGVVGDESDIMVWVYDVTNAVLVPLSSGFGLDGSGRFVGQFQTAPDSNDYRLILHIATTNASGWTFKVDSVIVGPSELSLGERPIVARYNVTASTANPTLADAATERLDFDSKVIDTHGAVTTGASWAFTAPETGWYYVAAHIRVSGVSWTLGDQLNMSLVVGGGGDGNIAFSTVQVSATFTLGAFGGKAVYAEAGQEIYVNAFQNGGTATVTQDSHSRISIHKIGGSSGGSSSRVVAFRATSDAGAALPTASGTPRIYEDVEFDTHAAYNNTTGEYTVPVTGYYRVSAAIQTDTGTYASGDLVLIRIENGGVNKSTGTTRVTSTASVNYSASISDVLYFQAGDVITAEAFKSGTAVNGSTSADTNFFSVSKVQGPSQTSSSETVAAIYYSTAGNSVSDATEEVIDFETKDKDTHNAVTTGGSWVFTAPVSGFYSYSAVAILTGCVAGTGEMFVRARVNGTDVQAGSRNGIESGAPAENISGVQFLEVGDELDFRVFQSNGVARNFAASAGARPFVSIHKV